MPFFKSNKEKLADKLTGFVKPINAFKVLFSVSFLCLQPLTLKVKADDKKQQQPSEAFLEFLAEMSEVDGELSDPLDMLEIDDNALPKKLLLTNDSNSISNPNTSNKIDMIKHQTIHDKKTEHAKDLNKKVMPVELIESTSVEQEQQL